MFLLQFFEGAAHKFAGPAPVSVKFDGDQFRHLIVSNDRRDQCSGAVYDENHTEMFEHRFRDCC